jgi:AraC family transcriptional regulator
MSGIDDGLTRDVPVRFAPLAQSRELRATSLGDLVVAECQALAGSRLPWHAHEHANVVLLLDGSFTERFGGRTVTCTSPVALYKPAAERHANEYGRTGARFLIVELMPSQLEPLRARGAVLDGIRMVHDPAVVDISVRLYRELRRLDPYSTLSIAGLVYELLAVMSRTASRDGGTLPPSWLRRVRAELDDHFATRVSIADLATRAQVHPDHLSRCFRRHYGLLIGDYVRRLRLEWTAQELTGSDTTLAELAIAAGFVDQSEFTRRFREQFGTTPGRYRAALAGKTEAEQTALANTKGQPR